MTGMTHAMLKGSNVPLDATAVRAVIRWIPGPDGHDVDASALLLGADGRVRSDEDFIFYNQPRHPSGLVRRLPKKAVTGARTDTVEVDLARLDPSVDQVVLAASTDRDVPFQSVRDLQILLYDAGAGGGEGQPLTVFEVKPETGEETAIICGELYRRGEGWKFRAVGQGYPTGLIGLATAFGISVDETETQPDQPAQAPAPVPPQPQEPPAYGYPQSMTTQPAYGYPQPAAAAAFAPDPNFRLPPMGPQFLPR
ncbi:TerD family protein [Streptomyces sp. NPDC050738]|uniref:TerD family protein n=1 Tax=Streptomyces sp. NPDC050738 TaxID=3154744 RepID=UPI0034327430